MNEKQNENMPVDKSNSDAVKAPEAVGADAKSNKSTVIIVAIIVSLVVALASVLGFFGYKYRNHIHAVYIWLTTSEEEIENNMNNAEEKQIDALVNSGFVNASKELTEAFENGLITPEEHTSILSGEFTLEDVLSGKAADNGVNGEENVQAPSVDVNGENELDDKTSSDEKTNAAGENKNETTPNKGGDTTKNDAQNVVTNNVTQNKPQTNTQTNTNISDVDKRVAELVTKMYVLKSEYTGAVEGVVASMKAEYSNLPADQRNKSSKVAIAERHMGDINAMEAQCDAQVNSVVTELRKLLKDNGRDTALADAIVTSYDTEKANTKAYYLSTYGD